MSPSRIVIFAFLAGILFVDITPGAPVGAEETNALLAEIAAAARKQAARKAEFKETRTSALLARPEITTGSLYFMQPGFLRKDTAGSLESSVRTDGQTLWMIYPPLREAEAYDLAQAPEVRKILETMRTVLDFSRLSESFRVRAERMAGGWRLEMTPRGALRREIKQLTATLDSNLDAREIFMEFQSGDTSRIELLSSEEWKGDADFFKFQPPEGFRLSYPMGR